jgi:hypothetical protein
MTIKTTHARKPSLLVAVSLFVTLGFLATSVAQAADSFKFDSANDGVSDIGASESWWQSVWGLNLTEKLNNWRPKITVEDDYDGINLARPFGKSGPALQASPSLPESARRGLTSGGGSQVSASVGSPDAYLFLQKRW